MKLLLYDSKLLPFKDRLTTEVGTGRPQDIFTLDCLFLYSSETDHGKLMVGADAYFFKNPTKSNPFPVPFFHSAAELMLTDVCRFYVQFGPNVQISPVVHVLVGTGSARFLLHSEVVDFNNLHLLNCDQWIAIGAGSTVQRNAKSPSRLVCKYPSIWESAQQLIHLWN